MTNFPVTSADTGLTLTDSLVLSERHSVSDTGATISSTTVLTINRIKAQTGLTVTESINRNWNLTLTDTGLSESDNLVHLLSHPLSSTGLTVTSAIKRGIVSSTSDIGLDVRSNIVTTPPGGTINGLPHGIPQLPKTPVDQTTVTYKWRILHFNYDGTTPISADYNGYSQDIVTNEVLHATNRTLNFYLNGLDDCSFTLYLDDPMAKLIQATKSTIKVYRTVYASDGSILYADEDTYPCFAGTVASTLKDGDANTMNVQCYSPLWRLQSRFHVRNHYLVTDQDTGEQYTGTGIMFKLVDLLNNAFPATGDAYTGIELGTRNWVGEPHMSPYFVAKGSNTWSLIFDDVLSRPASPDIAPTYNDDGSNIMMFLDSYEKRGADNSDTVSFNYHTGSNDNCENITEELSANPGEFANFLWAIGQGGANSGKVAVAWDNASGDYDSNSIGLYMKTLDKSEIKRVKPLTEIADAELKQSRWPKFAYNVTVSPYGGLIYNYHYDVGDVVGVRAIKGALDVDKKQRIYQVGLTMSDNNVEVAAPLVSNDFYGKVNPDGTVTSGGGGSGGGTPPPEPTLSAGFSYAE